MRAPTPSHSRRLTVPDIPGELATLPPLLCYALLFAVVALESAGLPVPGETSLATAALLAARGTLEIVAVIVVGAAAAIVGDNTGYVVGRSWGRRGLLAGRLLRDRRERLLDEAEGVFRNHGGKMVFFARWLPVLRVFGGPLAGISDMPWRRFFVANASGGILWATSISLLVYVTGRQQGTLGIAAAGAAFTAVAVGGHLLWSRLRTAPQDREVNDA
jgi:membrane protein DedA with SNARE-associated domain